MIPSLRSRLCLAVLLVGLANGCGSSESNETTGTDAKTEGVTPEFGRLGHTSDMCGVTEAATITENLREAGYDVEVTDADAKFDPQNTFVRLIVPVDELPKLYAPTIDVYCSPSEAQRAATESGNLQEGGVKYEFRVDGPALFVILAIPDYSIRTNKSTPVPHLDPIIDRVVADAGQ